MRDSEGKTAKAAKEGIRYLASKLADYGFALPERKFVFQMVFGILKQQSVILLQIARGLGEKAQLKKTVERLGKHLGRETLADRLMTALPQLARYKLRRYQHLVLDLSDVRKDYTRRMEGLRPVYDGSKGKVAPRYWTVNVVGLEARSTWSGVGTSVQRALQYGGNGLCERKREYMEGHRGGDEGSRQGAGMGV